MTVSDDRPAYAPSTGQRALVDRVMSKLRPLIESIIADQSASFDRARDRGDGPDDHAGRGIR